MGWGSFQVEQDQTSHLDFNNLQALNAVANFSLFGWGRTERYRDLISSIDILGAFDNVFDSYNKIRRPIPPLRPKPHR